jgi:hypothetical protein
MRRHERYVTGINYQTVDLSLGSAMPPFRLSSRTPTSASRRS